MADIEKVIDDLQDAVNDDWIWRRADYYALTMERAIALLKKQKPKPVGKEWNECPSCGKTLDRIHDMHYCGVCGQAVKWE